MNFNDLLRLKNIDSKDVLVMRHKPIEPTLKGQIYRIALQEPKLFTAYQSAHYERAESQLAKAKYLASFIGHQPAKAIFVALSRNTGAKSVSLKEYWRIPENKKLRQLGMQGFDGKRGSILWFNLQDTDFYPEWRGRLIVHWGERGERSWVRWAAKNSFSVEAIRESTAVEPEVPSPDQVHLLWAELKEIWPSWRTALQQWRGIYFILDQSDGKGYVGSAYGKENIYGRWMSYALGRGDGGNKKLRGRDPKNFVFNVLETVSPLLPPEEVVKIEYSWMKRLGTVQYGLNSPPYSHSIVPGGLLVTS